jgi:two-component system, cell cycle sensor histidine kinase and response regulator CckA
VSHRDQGLLLVLVALLPLLALDVYAVVALWERSGGARELGVLLGLGVAAGAGVVAVWLGTERLFRREARQLLHALRERVAGRPSALPTTDGELGQIARGIAQLDEARESLHQEIEAAEAQRRIAESRAAGVLAGVTDAVIGVGPSHQITLFNPSAERLFGYSAREALGQPLDLVLPALPDGPRETSRRPSPGERWETVGRRKDGRQLPLEIGAPMRVPGGPQALVLVLHEVTERAETALRQSEARFRGAFEHSPAGMAIQRPDGSFVRVNRALGEMLGYSEQELLAQTHQALRHPDDPEPDAWYERDLRLGSIRWYQREQRYRHKQGHVVWGLLSISLAGAAGEGPPDLLIQLYDITERKRAEALEAQLRQAQKIEAVGQLAAGVAHDFNNLLMVITGRSHILLYRLGPDHALRNHVELIRSTAERAGALTRQLLAFSRRQVLQPEVIDLNQVTTGMVPMLRRLIGEQIDLVTAPSPGLGRAKADPAQMEQVILNLVVNARDAMPDGGRLVIETADVSVDARFAQEHPGIQAGPHVTLAVRDTGVGMDAATQARLFEPFFTTKGPGKGTGLGLAVVYGIVKQSGGYIGVESQLGKGTVFTVYLPRADAVAEKAAPAALAPATAAPKGSETILLVEDEEAVRDLIGEILRQAGYTVMGARHGGEALVLNDRHRGPIDLLVTDVVMPEMGGRELAKRLTATRPAMKVIFMSGYTDDAVARHGVLEAGTEFVRKPVNPDTLLQIVRRALDTVPAEVAQPS